MTKTMTTEQIATWLEQATVGELLDTYTAVMGALRSSGVIRSGNQPTGDLAEAIAEKMYPKAKKASQSNQAWDLKDGDQTIQVKARRDVTSGGFFGFTNKDSQATTYLFMLLTRELSEVVFAYEITHTQMESVASNPLGGNARPGARRVSRTKLHNLKDKKDLTEQARAAFAALRRESAHAAVEGSPR